MTHTFNAGDIVEYSPNYRLPSENGVYTVERANWDGFVQIRGNYVYPYKLQMVKEHPDNIQKRKNQPKHFYTTGFVDDLWSAAPRWALYLTQDSDSGLMFSRWKPR